MNMMDIPYYQEITVLGFRFTSTIARSGNVTGPRAAGKIRSLVRDVYVRNLCLKQPIQYVHNILHSKIWHTSQKGHERQTLRAISWYTRCGAIFRVPLSTLQSRTKDEGKDLIDVAAQCRAL
jgi:hypothetical protein